MKNLTTPKNVIVLEAPRAISGTIIATSKTSIIVSENNGTLTQIKIDKGYLATFHLDDQVTFNEKGILTEHLREEKVVKKEPAPSKSGCYRHKENL